MDLNHDILRQKSKTELIRVIEEMKSERDAAKGDAARANGLLHDLIAESLTFLTKYHER